jgi:hypothetical protein
MKREYRAPILYDELTEVNVQAHLRHCAGRMRDADRIEIYAYEADVEIPVIKCTYKTKPTILAFLLRSGSIERDHLISLQREFEDQQFDIKLSFSPKRKQLNRIAVSVKVDDPLLSAKGTSVLRAVAEQLGCTWPCTFAISYGLTPRTAELPGNLKLDYPMANLAYFVGKVLGRVYYSLTWPFRW